MQEPVPDNTQVRLIDRIPRFLSDNKPFIVVWLALFISIVGIGMVSPLLPVFAEDMGASGIWLGLAFSGFAITQIPLMPLVGRFSDRTGKKFFLWSGLLIFAAAALGYVWSPSYHELVLFRVFSGIGVAMVIPTAFAYVGELAPLGYEARYMALFNMALIAGYGTGPVLGGVVYDGYGMDAAFASMAMPSVNAMAVERGREIGMGSVMGISNMAMASGLVIGSMVGGLIETSIGLTAVFRFIALLGLIGTCAFSTFMVKSSRFSRGTLLGIQSNPDNSATEKSVNECDKKD